MTSQIAQLVITLLQQNANSQEAVAMQSYMKNQFQFWGIKAPLRQQLMRQALKQYQLPEAAEVRTEIKLLWNYPKREAQYVAQDLYKRRIKQESSSAIEFLQWMICQNSWWDTVDFIASNLVGELVLRYPDLKQSHLKVWVKSPNLWLRRTSILFQLKYKNQVDEDFLLKAIEYNLNDDDFFMRKAIGWSLRQYSKFNPEFVNYVVDNYSLSKLSYKEATKYL